MCEARAEGLTRAASAPVRCAPRATSPRPRSPARPRIGAELTCTPGAWDATYALPTAGCATARRSAPAPRYTVTAADVGAALGCEVTAEGLTTEAAEPVAARGPHSLGAPVITGDPILRGKLTCSTGTWDGDVRADLPLVPRATTSAPRPDGTDDRGHQGRPRHVLQCEVTADGLTAARSEHIVAAAPARATQTVAGLRRPGRTLVCDPGALERPRVACATTSPTAGSGRGRSGDAIPGADQPTYVVRPRDVGRDSCTACVYGDGYVAATTRRPG